MSLRPDPQSDLAGYSSTQDMQNQTCQSLIDQTHTHEFPLRHEITLISKMFLASKSRKEYNALCHCPPFLGEADKPNRRGFGVQVQHHQTPLQYMYVYVCVCFRYTVASLFFNMFQCCINLVKPLQCRGSQKRSTQHYKLPCPPPSLVLAKWGAHPSCHQISGVPTPGPNIWCNMTCQYVSYLLLAPSMAGVLLKQCICIHAMHVLFQEVLYLRVIRVLYKNYVVLLISIFFVRRSFTFGFTSFTEQWTSRRVSS